MASTNRNEDVVCLACLPSIPLIRVDTPGYVLVNETSVSLRHKIDSRRPRFPGLGNAVPLCPPSENRLDHWVGTLHAVDMTAGRVRVRIMNGWYCWCWPAQSVISGGTISAALISFVLFLFLAKRGTPRGKSSQNSLAHSLLSNLVVASVFLCGPSEEIKLSRFSCPLSLQTTFSRLLLCLQGGF